MNEFSELLINILIIILSILFFFLVPFKQKFPRLGIALLSAFAVILCMAFPFSVLSGYKYDLRTIPLVIGILYGGWQVGAFVCLVMFIYRYYLGGPGFILTLYSFPLIIILSFMLISKFQEKSRRFKIFTASSLSFLWAFSCTLISFSGSKAMPVNPENLMFYVCFCLLHVVAMWISIYLIENLRETEEMRREIQRTETLNALSELAASVAHEIRNPMTVVRGFMQLLNERQKDETERRYMQLMITELDQAETIINNFLSLSKPQSEEIEEFDAAEQIHQVVSVISSYGLMQDVEIKLNIESPLSICVNRAKLRQVLLNLIKNGIEAMPGGGTMQIIGYSKLSKINIEIIDEGIGMTPAEINQLGTPFYSTKKKGTGLGLLTCYRMVHMMKGHIEVQSEQGKGTRFIIQIPEVKKTEND